MDKLYKKSELWFALAWIITYVVGSGITDGLSNAVGVPKLITLLFYVALCVLALIFIKKNGFFEKYGLCKAVSAKHFLYYIPLALICSVNFWFGVGLHSEITDAIILMLCMLCVGFLEEIIFRGFLFKAMAKDNVKVAIMVSGITFGVGHIVNLFNQSGMGIVQTLCQILYATAAGFLFVLMLHRGKSLIPCIIAHSFINAASVFSNVETLDIYKHMALSGVLLILNVAYAAVLTQTLPKSEE